MKFDFINFNWFVGTQNKLVSTLVNITFTQLFMFIIFFSLLESRI